MQHLLSALVPTVEVPNGISRAIFFLPLSFFLLEIAIDIDTELEVPTPLSPLSPVASVSSVSASYQFFRSPHPLSSSSIPFEGVLYLCFGLVSFIS